MHCHMKSVYSQFSCYQSPHLTCPYNKHICCFEGVVGDVGTGGCRWGIVVVVVGVVVV
jgi:hypothetical protein